MPAAAAVKRVAPLGDQTSHHNNVNPTVTFDSTANKKRKLDASFSSNGTQNKSFRGTQAKSSFEEELGRLTQELKGLQGSNAETDQKWSRPSIDKWTPNKEALILQQIDAEEGFYNGKTCVRLFGVTEAGHSVLLHVTDFLHYLYIAAPVGFDQSHTQQFAQFLETKVSSGRSGESVIANVKIVMKENLYGFQNNQKSPYLMISVTDPKHIGRVRSILAKGEANYKGMWRGVEGSMMTFDNVQFIMRFMVDTKIGGMSWVEIPKDKYRFIQPGLNGSRQGTAQIEASCHYRDMIALSAEGEYSKMAPLRIMSFDIECAGRKGIFPDAKIDPVIQIATAVTRYGDKQPFIRNVFCLNTCASVVNTQILEFAKEDDMLYKWTKFLQEVDPDVLIGYNTSNFDFPYLLERARQLKVKDFPYWTRLSNLKSEAKDTSFSSKQLGTRESKYTNTNGRIQLDLLQLLQRDHHLRSYTLNSVCAHFLGEQKEDVPHTIITELFNGTAESRRRLAVYCLKDAILPQRLMDKLMCLVNYTEMARVTGVPFNHLLSKGQQIKFMSQLFRKAGEQHLVVPDLKNEGGEGEAYEGATVIEPTRGYYSVPIATLDFSSLYPSIMQAHNLCYTTLIRKDLADKWGLVKDVDYSITPNGDIFIKASKRKGLLPMIFEDLLGARKRAKDDLKKETDPFKKAVLNGRQLALKISANSVYGITGATVGKLPCLAIASSVTSYGRQMIEKTKEEVEKKYTIANGYSHDAQVIYGDTDSVMVKFGPEDLKTTMDLGEEAATYISSKFIKPIKLEFEKVYYPYLLINKKRYAGLYWTNPDKYDKMDSKGIETVRRDNCRLVQNVIETCLRKILIDRDVDGAQEYVKDMIADLLQNKVDLSNLVITKALSKTGEEYAGRQAHVELAERMRKRDAGSAPALGDRVAYVIIKGAGGAKNYEKSEDPIYVLEHNVPIDTKYYLDNQLSKPLIRIFEPILGATKANSLLTGDHTRTVAKAAASFGGLMKFAKKTQTCMGCKTPLTRQDEADGAVCINCRPRFGELYQKTLAKQSELEVRFGRLWTQCQRCQGSIHCEVICSSRDCPIFYMRMKAKKEVEDSGKELKRFDQDISAW